MNKNYGFSTMHFDNGLSVQTLETGDGKSEFTDMFYSDGTAAIGFSYGGGTGIGIERQHEKLLSEDLQVQWQVKFDNQRSVDAMITTLLRVKNHLAKSAEQQYKEALFHTSIDTQV